MKKIIASILAASVVYVSGEGHAIEFERGNIYPAAMAIEEVRQVADSYEVSARTMTGIEYVFYSSDGDWEGGGIVAVTMNDNGTADDVTDDFIIEARYAGFGNPASW